MHRPYGDSYSTLPFVIFCAALLRSLHWVWHSGGPHNFKTLKSHPDICTGLRGRCLPATVPNILTVVTSCYLSFSHRANITSWYIWDFFFHIIFKSLSFRFVVLHSDFYASAHPTSYMFSVVRPPWRACVCASGRPCPGGRISFSDRLPSTSSCCLRSFFDLVVSLFARSLHRQQLASPVGMPAKCQASQDGRSPVAADGRASEVGMSLWRKSVEPAGPGRAADADIIDCGCVPRRDATLVPLRALNSVRSVGWKPASRPAP